MLERIRRHGQLIRAAAMSGSDRHALRRRYQFDLARQLGDHVTATHDGMTFLVDTNDRTVGRDTYVGGAYELDVMTTAIRLLERYCGEGWLIGHTFIEVGANIGTTTVPALGRFGASGAVCFEPDPVNARLLRANLALNDVGDRVRVVEAAVTDHNGEVRLAICEVNRGDHRVTTGPGLTVQAVRLDDALTDDERSDAALLWLDTQGHEPLVLEGTSLVIPTIAEFWPPVLRETGLLSDFMRIVRDRYATVIDVRSGVLRPSREIEFFARAREDDVTDLLLLP